MATLSSALLGRPIFTAKPPARSRYPIRRRVSGKVGYTVEMVEITVLTQLVVDDLKRVITGYTSPYKYALHKTEGDDQTIVQLQLVSLERPYVKQFDEYLAAETLAGYRRLLEYGLSFGAYQGERLVGLALAEPQTWNNSLWVWEFHIAEPHRGRGIGRQLMEFLAEKGKAAGLRAIFCETQTTNVPAIRFYRRLGFTLDGLNLSFYTNEDWPDGEMALFMKKRLP